MSVLEYRTVEKKCTHTHIRNERNEKNEEQKTSAHRKRRIFFLLCISGVGAHSRRTTIMVNVSLHEQMYMFREQHFVVLFRGRTNV